MVRFRSALIFPSISHTATRETGSRPVVGSSRKKMRGSCTRPRAISTRRRMPPDRFFTCLSRHCVSSTAASSSAISRSRFCRGTPYNLAKMIRFSSTLRSRSLVIAWGMTPIDLRTSSASRTMSKPLTRAVPAVGGSSVVSIRISVDLPAPLGPRRPKISPSPTAKLIPFTAVKSPKRLTICRTSIAFTIDPGAGTSFIASLQRQGHVSGHPDGQAPVLVVGAQPDLEGLDVAFGPAHVALRGEAGIGAAVEHRPFALHPRRQAHRQPIAEADPIDVGFFDVDADPQVVGIDQGD